MITILSMLEKGYESSFEHLAFRQLKGAYGCELVCVPHHYATMEEALADQTGSLVFMVPPGRVADSVEFSEYTLPPGDVTFCFGSPQENMVGYVSGDVALHITTKGSADMMAVCVAAQVLHVHG